MGASTAREKAITPFHCARVRTAEKPCGGLSAAWSVWNQVVFAQVPLTRR